MVSEASCRRMEGLTCYAQGVFGKARLAAVVTWQAARGVRMPERRRTWPGMTMPPRRSLPGRPPISRMPPRWRRWLWLRFCRLRFPLFPSRSAPLFADGAFSRVFLQSRFFRLQFQVSRHGIRSIPYQKSGAAGVGKAEGLARQDEGRRNPPLCGGKRLAGRVEEGLPVDDDGDAPGGVWAPCRPDGGLGGEACLGGGAVQADRQDP